jgi:L-2-hydroxyglutarate oxidase
VFSDEIAKLNEKHLDTRIIPFRGEYYKLKPEKRYMVKNIIYPVPDPAFPFLGVHFTRMMNGEIEAGPNAVLAFKKEGYSRASFSFGDSAKTFTWSGFYKIAAKYYKTGIGEFYRSLNKSAFVKALQKLMPEITEDDLIPGGAGVRAQAIDKEGMLVDDFLITENGCVINVLNAPSPAATSSLSIGETIALKAVSKLGSIN